MPQALIESLDRDGQGICRDDGKTIFVDGALPGERVEFEVYRSKPRYDRAVTTRVISASAQRVVPRCGHFGECGGCSMQHLDAGAQVAAKQRVLEDAFAHIGGVAPAVVYPPVYGAAWRYRERARLTVRKVDSKGGVLIGFHQRRSSHVADMTACDILPAHVSDMVPALHALVAGLTIADRLPQIEVSIGGGATALVFRVLQQPDGADLALLRRFASERQVQVWLQSGAPATAYLLEPVDAPGLCHLIPEFGLRLEFRPTDFVQVNEAANRLLIRRAMGLLAPRAGEHIADLFCGFGNFGLPMARRGARVVGVEGNAALVERARQNALSNGLGDRVEFHAADLFETTADSLAALGEFDKWLIDPPREGAIAVVKAIGQAAPRRIVYVSCNPATLARDAAVLVHEKRYVLRGAGVVNLFAQTSHVESIALFERR